jgi:hypothetical protein
MRRLPAGLSWPLFGRLPPHPLSLFKQALPVKLVSFSLWEDPAFFFIDVVPNQFLKDFESGVERGGPRPWPESVQLLQEDMHEVVFLEGFVDHVGVPEGRAKRGIDDPFFDSGMRRQFANDPMGDLGFFSITGLGILREQRTHELMVIAKQLDDVRK